MTCRCTPLNFCQVFPNDDGTPNDDPEAGLRLALSDLAAEALTDDFQDLDISFHISVKHLCRYLDEAEQRASIVKEKKGVVNPRPLILKKRRRPGTPPENLDEVHEQRFQDAEKRAFRTPCAR